MISRKGQHVVPSGSRWSVVRKAGSSKDSGTYSTQREAIGRGKEIARNQRTELYIHGSDRRIREKIIRLGFSYVQRITNGRSVIRHLHLYKLLI